MNEISIDFTSLIKGENKHVFAKIFKQYRSDKNPFRPLFIVIYGQQDANAFNDVKNKIGTTKERKICKLITLDQYSKLFSFSNDLKKLLNDLSELSIEALRYDSKFEELENFNFKYLKLLKSSSQKSLSDY